MRIKKYFLELQYRIFFVLFNCLLISFLSYFYKKEIIYILGSNQKELFPYFISTHLTEIFSVYLKISLFLGFYFSIPLLILEIQLFLAPALYKYENKIMKKYSKQTLFIFIFCTVFAYLFFIPYCWKFFSSFQSSLAEGHVPIHFEARLYAYCNFFLESIFFIQILFQFLGFFLFFLPQVKPNFYAISRKLIYFLFLLLATLVTPPDILSQTGMALLFILIYENFVFFFLVKKEYKRANNGI